MVVIYLCLHYHSVSHRYSGRTSICLLFFFLNGTPYIAQTDFKRSCLALPCLASPRLVDAGVTMVPGFRTFFFKLKFSDFSRMFSVPSYQTWCLTFYFTNLYQWFSVYYCSLGTMKQWLAVTAGLECCYPSI